MEVGKGFKSTNYEEGDEKWKCPGIEVEVCHCDASSLELSLAWTKMSGTRGERGGFKLLRLRTEYQELHFTTTVVVHWLRSLL